MAIFSPRLLWSVWQSWQSRVCGTLRRLLFILHVLDGLVRHQRRFKIVGAYISDVPAADEGNADDETAENDYRLILGK